VGAETAISAAGEAADRGGTELLRGKSEPEEYQALFTQDVRTLLALLVVSGLVLLGLAVVHFFRRSGKE
ncbi:MAG: hypothetical protein ACOC28_05545, partial [Alkalispirochaetaceae bacterium]